MGNEMKFELAVGGLVALLALSAGAEEVETAKWQAAIDAAAARGGGRVMVPAGRHLVGGLEIRSNVELHLEEGASLEGLVGLENYRVVELPYSEGTWSAIIMGLSVTNVAITGTGEIFGNGEPWPQPDSPGGNQEGLRARGVFFSNSKDIRLEDFRLRDVACWGIVFHGCDGVVARRVRIDNHANYNNDGFDIEAANALFEDCDVDSADDAFVLKSNIPTFAVTNVIVRNCIARSHCYAYKLGTASHGTMADIRFENNLALPPRRDFIDRRSKSPNRGNPFYSRRENYAGYPFGVGGGALAVECVDGGVVERVVCDGLEAYGYMVPIFVRGGTRKGRCCGTPPNDKYVLREIAIRNVRGVAASTIASSMSGVDGCRAVNVTLENVEIVCRGAGEEKSRKALSTPVPDVSGEYPAVTMFHHILPAYGLWVDRADNLVLRNVSFRLRPSDEDVRPAVSGVTLK